MHNEIEVRFLDIDVKDLRKKLKSLDALFIGDWNQKRYIYDYKPAIQDKWIRLRTNGKETTLTLKEYHDSSIKGTKELEITVSDFKETDLILNKLGYKARSIQENKRIRYILDGVEIDIDTWPHLKPFVEFEGKNEKSIKKVVEKLGLNYDESTTKNVETIYFENGFSKEDLNELKMEEE